MTFEAIIFDMDGTLVDSEVVWEKAERQMLSDRGLVYTEEVRQQVIGLRLDEFFEKWIDIYGLDETVQALSEDLLDRMLAMIPGEVDPKPGAQAILEYAAEQAIPRCIASSSPMSIIEATVTARGWHGLIPRLFTADSVEKGKPAPDVYLYAAEQLGADPARCLAIEDSPTGTKSAVAAGMTCYTVPDFHSRHVDFSDLTPHVFESLDEVLAKLKTLNA